MNNKKTYKKAYEYGVTMSNPNRNLCAIDLANLTRAFDSECVEEVKKDLLNVMETEPEKVKIKVTIYMK